MVVVPVDEEFWLSVAVTVTLPGETGAVNSPLALMAPLFADQLTAELAPVAVHWDVPSGATEEGVQDTAIRAATEVAREVLPPHAVKEIGMTQIKDANRT